MSSNTLSSFCQSVAAAVPVSFDGVPATIVACVLRRPFWSWTGQRVEHDGRDLIAFRMVTSDKGLPDQRVEATTAERKARLKETVNKTFIVLVAADTMPVDEDGCFVCTSPDGNVAISPGQRVSKDVGNQLEYIHADSCEVVHAEVMDD